MSTIVILERQFDPGLTVADVIERVRTSDWCFDLYRVTWNASYLSADGHKMVCWLSAPDAESARTALRQGGADTRVLWKSTLHEGSPTGRPNVLVERTFAEPTLFEEIQARENAGEWCMRTHQVQFVRSFFSADRRRMLCLYEAPDAESVRIAQRKAGMPVDAVWAFDCIDMSLLDGSDPG